MMFVSSPVNGFIYVARHRRPGEKMTLLVLGLLLRGHAS